MRAAPPFAPEIRMKIGDRVHMRPRKKGQPRGFDCTVVNLDGDDCIGNPEEFLTVRLDNGELFAFRRGANDWDDWHPRAKSLLKIKSNWICEGDPHEAKGTSERRYARPQISSDSDAFAHDIEADVEGDPHEDRS